MREREREREGERAGASIFSNAHVGISITLAKPTACWPPLYILAIRVSVLIERVAVKLERREKIRFAKSH